MFDAEQCVGDGVVQEVSGSAFHEDFDVGSLVRDGRWTWYPVSVVVEMVVEILKEAFAICGPTLG